MGKMALVSFRNRGKDIDAKGGADEQYGRHN